MAIRHVEGWETHRESVGLGDRYETITNITGSSYSAGRHFGFALGGSTSLRSFKTKGLSSQRTWVVGWAWQVTDFGITGADVSFLQIFNGASIQLTLEAEQSGSDYLLKLWRGDRDTGTLLETSTVIGAGSGWNYFELKVYIDSTNGTWELRKQGVPILSGSGNTQALGSNTANKFQFTLDEAGGDQLLDDIYILDDTGSVNNDFLGDQVAEGILPNAVGALEQWDAEDSGTPVGDDNYTQVDDGATVEADDTDYVVTDGVGNEDLYGFENLSFITGGINAVYFATRARIEGTGTRVLTMRYRDPGGTVYNGPTITVNSGVYDEYPQVMETNPDTSAKFTLDDINNGQFGFELTS